MSAEQGLFYLVFTKCILQRNKYETANRSHLYEIRKKVDFAGVFVNIVNLGVWDLLPEEEGINPLCVNLLIEYSV